MQNTPQTFRGSSAPGVNYSDHTFDNHLGGHCQSSGYQPYSNQQQLYHPRPHHYGNHQMQQNMPYRHHGGGAYAPNQNQYGSNMNQDMYRNHHQNYAGNNNSRNIPSKTWTESNSNDLMSPYSQASPHTQMMNSPSQMPVTAMRSPPHAASNMNPSPQGQQHYRPMQSPAHSPHSWSQAQIPSPGMMHSSRTSPAHVRSPGHSQPFSPPSSHSMNPQPHLPPQENGQIPQTMCSSGGNDNHNPGNPLHSLQKMVLLDQDPKAMMAVSSDGSEQFPNQCGPQKYGPDACTSNDPKDSQYSTYYNMDENRFESKPNSAANDASVYTPIPQVANCNYPALSHSVSNETDVASTRIPSNMNPNVADTYHTIPNQNSILPHQINSAIEQCKSSIPQNDCSKQNECPPHAESAPVFTDQTKAAVSTNSEQALESKSNTNWISDTSEPEKASVAQVSFADTSHSSMSQTQCDTHETPNKLTCKNLAKETNNAAVNSKDHENYFCSSESVDEKQKDMTNPSIGTPSSESQDCDSNITSSDCKSSVCEDSQGSEKKVSLRHRRGGISYEDVPSPEAENRSLSQPESSNSESKSSNNSSSNQNESESNSSVQRNPVKVVIHRIRKNDADDTWHVPGSTSESIKVESQNEAIDEVSETKASGGPQIIMLSPAVSDKRSHNFDSSNSVASTNNDQTEKDSNLPVTVKKEIISSSEKGSSSFDKKRGRPAGSKNKTKPSSLGKSKRGKKGAKKRKNDICKQKVTETVSKVKKIKNFNGPFVRITGNKDNPSSISVVNVAQKEEEKLTKTQTKRNIPSAVNRIKSKTVGHLSTLSPTYDAYNRDKTWVCVFCQKGSHHGGLGDLYGPYYIKDNSEDKTCPSASAGTSATRNKRRKSENDDSKTPKRAKQASTHTTPNQPQNDSETVEPTKEVWIHEDCAVWCQSITLIGEEVRGLEEAVAESNENKCSECAFHGATLGCWGKGCKEMYHYTCAKSLGCQLDIEKFSLLCPKHQNRSQ